MTHRWVSQLGNHWLRKLLIVSLWLNHYLNQYWLIINLTLGIYISEIWIEIQQLLFKKISLKCLLQNGGTFVSPASVDIHMLIARCHLQTLFMAVNGFPCGKRVLNRSALQWRHNERYAVSNRRRLDCLLNHLFRWGSQKTSKLCVTGRCEGNSPVHGRFNWHCWN